MVSADHLLTLSLEEGASTLASAQLVPADVDITDIVDACRGGQQRLDVVVRTLAGVGFNRQSHVTGSALSIALRPHMLHMQSMYGARR